MKHIICLCSALFFSNIVLATPLDEGLAAYEKGDLNRAFMLVSKAAETKDVKSQFQLAQFYENGIGTLVHLKKAFLYYQLAADQGDVDSQYHVGRMYENGLGIKRNYENAVKYYELATKGEQYEAKLALGLLYLYGKGVEKNEEIAFRYFKEATEKNNTVAPYYVAVCEQNKENYEKAYQSYLISAKNNYLPAIKAIAALSFYGKGTPKNEKEAFFWNKKAAELNDMNAQAFLGVAYEKGVGVTPSIEESIKWYELAANQGHINAKQMLLILK